MMSSFCEWVKTNGVVHLKLTGGGDDHYLTEVALDELHHKLAEIRKLAAAEPCRGLITTSSTGSFCNGIDYEHVRASMEMTVAEKTSVLADRMAAVIKELLTMPMLTVCAATGNAASLGLALALAHDDLVVLGGASYRLGMVEDGVAVHPHIGALIREKTDRWYTLTTLKSRSRSGNWMRRWYFADCEGDSPDDVLREAQKLVDGWTSNDGVVHANMRKQLYRETWAAVSAILPEMN
ncbi:enoyl-CoA delta isomerase 1, peroxisomal-like [Phragmites australis]|uniref:enoyl-CoA delta isomerase 1, peroxisomal-like n=1 Tax=Phragmites australis TaxID=29695 RepID=UPI002D772AF3|nr:enoyl-CoA delta isomerase 1, peroxisomal-like [Phragmites australis]